MKVSTAQTPNEVRVTPTNEKRLREYADKHLMSRSEVLRSVLQQIEDGTVPTVKPEGKTKRILFRDPSGILDRVSRRARRMNVTVVDLVDAAIEEVLG